MSYEVFLSDCVPWMSSRPGQSLHAIVTDPPYGVREYSDAELAKMKSGRGGVWRQPPSLGGSPRSALPRFTTLSRAEEAEVMDLFRRFAAEAFRVLVPGAHVVVAANPLLSHLVFNPLADAGFERRGQIVRLVQTLRGGDRPKGAEEEFGDVTVMPRSQWEPWGVFRRPCEGRVQDNLRRWGTGGLRRISRDQPFGDVIRSAPTSAAERRLAPHPSLKPQAFMRQIVRAVLPLGRGVVLDPFMGSGSTVAAAEAIGYEAIGVERSPSYFELAKESIPRLSRAEVVPLDRRDTSR